MLLLLLLRVVVPSLDVDADKGKGNLGKKSHHIPSVEHTGLRLAVPIITCSPFSVKMRMYLGWCTPGMYPPEADEAPVPWDEGRERVRMCEQQIKGGC